MFFFLNIFPFKDNSAGLEFHSCRGKATFPKVKGTSIRNIRVGIWDFFKEQNQGHVGNGLREIPALVQVAILKLETNLSVK